MNDFAFFVAFLASILFLVSATLSSHRFTVTESDRDFKMMVGYGVIGISFALLAIIMLIKNNGH